VNEATVLLGSFEHETNTFVDRPTTRADFRARREFFGEAVERLRDTETAVGGAVALAGERGVDLRPTVAASATPGGVVAADAYEQYTDRIVEGAREHAGDVDGVLLALHGAMVPEGENDGEGPLIERVRAVVGPETPVVVTLDLHANVTERMVREADALVAYETYPHLDKAETGRRALSMLLDAVAGDVAPTTRFERPPSIVFQPKAYTPEGPMAEVMARARDLEKRPGVLKANVLPGYYHADVPEMGVTTPVVTDDDPALAREVARDLATLLWERREEFVEEYPEPPAAVRRARECLAERAPGDGPVVMGDFGPNPGGGGTADGTTLLRELIDQGVEDAGYAVLWDPEVVEACREAGVGERVTVTLGGKADDRHGGPIEDLDVYVKAITDGRFVNTGSSHTGRGLENDLGPTVLLRCGPDDGVSVVVSGTRHSAFDAEVWRHVGVRPERAAVLAVPSFVAFLGDYGPMASGVVLVDSPGLSAVDPARFDYERIPRPLFPLDDLPDDAYPP